MFLFLEERIGKQKLCAFFDDTEVSSWKNIFILSLIILQVCLNSKFQKVKYTQNKPV